MKFWLFTLIVAATLCLSGCSGSSPAASSTSQPPPAATYSIGGSVSGLTGTGLTLQDNGGNNLSLGAGATSFTFTTSVASGDAYSVTVLTQPSTPSQNCAVTNASGTATANVTNVQVTCTTTAANLWTWMSGSNLGNQFGTYGTLGVTASGNVPGARQNSFTWIDASGNLWLFGGYGFDSTGQFGDLNDLWKYSAGQWTWMGGSNVYGDLGSYGIQGTANPSNVPPARDSGVSWTDAAGNFWLFGGTDYNAHTNGGGFLNDLWKFSAGQWTWMSGSNTADQPPIYGVQGTAAPGNVPGARVESSGWIDASGDLWLFGGYGEGSYTTRGNFSDLWKYSAGQWTWIGGPNTPAQQGIYGALGIAGPANVPGARDSAVGGGSLSGSFWLFGGDGLDSTGNAGFLNDLWEYGSGEWTWVSGSNLGGASGNYGTQGAAAPTNSPPARQNSLGWTDNSGNFWIFGGVGYNANFNDLWKFNAGEWTWVSGSNVANQTGVYGTLGMAASRNVPGARNSSVSWVDASGNLWLFGGVGYDSMGLNSSLNDLWKYQP